MGLSAVVYTIWGTSDEQPWNTDGKFVTENAEVVQELTLTAKKNKEIEIDNKSSSMIDISTWLRLDCDQKRINNESLNMLIFPVTDAWISDLMEFHWQNM